MSELSQRTKQLISRDRLELMRARSDEKNTYCVFASMYEVALQIHEDRLPPRVEQAEREWLSFGTGKEVEGGVSPEELFDTLVKLANFLDIKIRKIYSNPSALAHFLGDKVASANVLTRDKNGSEDNVDDAEEKDDQDGEGDTYYAHAETQTSSPKADARIEEAMDKGWFVVLVVSFDQKPAGGDKKKLDQIPIEPVVGKTERISFPYLLVFLKE